MRFYARVLLQCFIDVITPYMAKSFIGIVKHILTNSTEGRGTFS